MLQGRERAGPGRASSGSRWEKGQAGPALGRAGRGWAERGEEKGNWAGRVWGFGLDSGFWFLGFMFHFLFYFLFFFKLTHTNYLNSNQI